MPRSWPIWSGPTAQPPPVAGDSTLAEAVKVLARTHQSLVWTRQRQLNQLRSLLREFYPGALAAVGGDLGAATPWPSWPWRRPRPWAASRHRPSWPRPARAGRQRAAEDRAAELAAILRAPQLGHSGVVAGAFRAAVALGGCDRDPECPAGAAHRPAAAPFDQHPDAEILRSLPGLGLVLGARVVGEFGDDPTRYHHPKARKAYAGTALVTRASGKRQLVVAGWPATGGWPMPAICGRSRPWGPLGRPPLLDRSRAAGQLGTVGPLALANRLVGILHGCRATTALTAEHKAWPAAGPAALAPWGVWRARRPGPGT